MDASSTITFRYPTNALLEKWDTFRGFAWGDAPDALYARPVFTALG